jgi:hypothetical protein
MSIQLSKKSLTNIKPYVPQVENMGLEELGLSLFPGVVQMEPLGFIEKNGVRRYLTGLNEDAPEIRSLPDEKRAAAIKDIRETVAKLNKMLLGGDEVDPSLKNKDFWKQCALLAPTNDSFYGEDKPYPEGFTLALDSNGMSLDLTNPSDIIIERAIRAGGYACLIAGSLEEAQKKSVAPKFYLEKYDTTIQTGAALRETVNAAKAKLNHLKATNVDQLFLIAKNYDPHPIEYKKSTPVDVVYTNLDRAIDGELWEKSKYRAAETFLKICEMSNEELYIRSIINIAKSYRFIDQKNDGFYYFLELGTILGRTLEEAYLYLKNGINEDILTKLQKKVDFEMNQ